MKDAIHLAGLAVIFAVASIAYAKTSEKRVTQVLDDLAWTVTAPLTAEVEAWLRPHLRRRVQWIGIGATLGMVAAHLPLPFLRQELPWYWFSVALGVVAGSILGTLAAGYRSFPKLDSSLRTVRPNVRAMRDYVCPRDLALMHCALPMPVAAVALGAVVMTHGHRELGELTMAFCGSGAVVVALSVWALRTLVIRPMVTSTIEGLMWHEALLAWTVDHLPGHVSLLGFFSSLIGVYAVVQARDDLPWWVLSATGLFLLLSLAALGYFYRPGGEGTSVPALPPPRESAW